MEAKERFKVAARTGSNASHGTREVDGIAYTDTSTQREHRRLPHQLPSRRALRPDRPDLAMLLLMQRRRRLFHRCPRSFRIPFALKLAQSPKRDLDLCIASKNCAHTRKGERTSLEIPAARSVASSLLTRCSLSASFTLAGLFTLPAPPLPYSSLQPPRSRGIDQIGVLYSRPSVPPPLPRRPVRP